MIRKLQSAAGRFFKCWSPDPGSQTISGSCGLSACCWVMVLVFFTGCSGAQSALDPGGKGASQIYRLTLWMFAGGILVWMSVAAVGLYATCFKSQKLGRRKAGFFIIGGGIVIPSVILGLLLAYGLSLMPQLLQPAPPGSLRIAVEGRQWWWRIRYLPHESEEVELANEIRLPVNEPVEFLLSSSDVVHSFWIPALGPKVDMIPGRQTRLSLHPTRTGRFRGVCAEYCGTSHALMALDVIVMEKAEFSEWLKRQYSQAQSEFSEGGELFLATGCGACHTVRGTDADGTLGPDLTHVGSRLSLGAGIVQNDLSGLMRWLSDTPTIKPGVHMPHFGMLSPSDQRSLAEFLNTLK